MTESVLKQKTKTETHVASRGSLIRYTKDASKLALVISPADYQNKSGRYICVEVSPAKPIWGLDHAIMINRKQWCVHPDKLFNVACHNVYGVIENNIDTAELKDLLDKLIVILDMDMDIA